jgi:hypothetical protein
MRQELLEQTGLIVVRWGWVDLADLPRLVDRIGRALVRGSRMPAAEKAWIVGDDQAGRPTAGDLAR